MINIFLLPGSEVHEVPDKSSYSDTLSDIQDKILHEMKALEDDLNEISDIEL